MLPIIFALGLLQTQLLELQAELPRIEPIIAQVETYSIKRYKYRPVTNKTKFLEVNEWKRQLRKCESGGNDNALNPKDLDGTPSHGRYQFKDTTFYGFAKQYGIKVTSHKNGDEQELILDRMILDPKVDLTFQFPGCTTKIGLPALNYIDSFKKE
jgi:hypothetical protein